MPDDVPLEGGLGGLRDLGARRFDVDADGDLLAEREPAMVQRLVEGDSELLAVDAGGGGEAGAVLAPGILEAAAELDVENGRTGDAVDAQISGHAQPFAVDRLDARALEG